MCGQKIVAVLYEDSNVKITFKNAERYKYDNTRLEMYFYLQNKTSKTLLIQADAVSLNGYCFKDLIMSDEVLAQTVGFVDVSVKGYDFGLTPINSISTVGGQLRIIDDHNWSDIYKATFYNVSVTR